jgi:hypothetical protein
MNEEPRHKMTVKVVDALRTIQGYSMDEYRAARDELIDDLAKDLEAVQLAKAIGAAAPLAAPFHEAAPPIPAAPVTEAPVWGDPTPAPSASFMQATVPNCPHGPLKPLTGVGAKGPWKGWFCVLQKGDPAQCTPKFATRGTPEFNNFPV